MKKFKKILLAVLLLGTSASVLVGCGGSGDAEAILDKALAETKNVESLSSSVIMDMGVEMTADDSTLAMNMAFNVDVDQDKNGSMYLKGNVSMDFFGQSEDQDMESYIVKNADGDYVEITKDDDEWAVYSSDGDSGVDSKTFVEMMQEAKSLKTDGSGEVNGKKTTKIVGKISGDDLQKEMEELSETDETIASMLADLDFKGKDLEIKAEFYDDSGLIALISIDMSELLNDMFTAMMGDEDLEELGIELNIEKFELKVEFKDYNDVKEIELPKEAKKLLD